MSSLPSGWSDAQLAELVASDGLFSDGDWVESKDQDSTGSIRLLQLADIGDGLFLDKSRRFLNEEQFERLRCTPVLPGDVLVARMPDPLGRACIAPDANQRRITVVDVAIIRPGRESVHSRWLMHNLNSPEIRRQVELQSSGTTRKRISRAKLGSLRTPVPPLAEQRRIAHKADLLLARVRECRVRLDRVPQILKRFREAVLEAAVTGGLTKEWRNAKGVDRSDWSSTQLDSVVTRIEAGLNVRCEERPPNSAEKGLVKISAVTWGQYDDNQSKTLPSSHEVSETTRIRVGDFLLSRANTLEFVGACVIVDRVTRPVYLSDKILRLVMPEELKRWILLYLQSPRGRKQIQARASGNQLSMRNLSQANLLAIEIQLPSDEEREEIVRRIDRLMGAQAELQERWRVARKAVDQTAPSMLSKAFRGELVPQNPADEPAEKMLQNLRSERDRLGNLSQQPRVPPRRMHWRKTPIKPSGRERRVAMAKSRSDSDVKGQPYLAGLLRENRAAASVQELFSRADLPIADFYKQLAWEIDAGHIKERKSRLEAA